MGGNGSTGRKVSFGMDEEEKVTVIEGVKLSEDVLRRMRDAEGSLSSKKPPTQQNNITSGLKSPSHSATELQEEIRRNFENQQALVQEQLARISQSDQEAATTVGLEDLSPSRLMEKGKAWEEHEKAKLLLSSRLQKLGSVVMLGAFHPILKPTISLSSSYFHYYMPENWRERNKSWPAFPDSTKNNLKYWRKKTLTLTNRRLNSTTRQPQKQRPTSGPDRLHQFALSYRPGCSSVTEKILSKPCIAPVWPNST
ncbi:MICOS complex subunit mic25a-like isoform X3 [Corythoichthys intestinalis]|uniref:MICOS complex subunit mic25a-like isoform X3 n=1 Tax=Corythoichthys intestinalis TaxID=161448 RepID=UPI0025A5E855|nr:MICOS complex subunit mic25a-like isoform X3 [Corythoichthys intestinalis]